MDRRSRDGRPGQRRRLGASSAAPFTRLLSGVTSGGADQWNRRRRTAARSCSTAAGGCGGGTRSTWCAQRQVDREARSAARAGVGARLRQPRSAAGTMVGGHGVGRRGGLGRADPHLAAARVAVGAGVRPLVIVRYSFSIRGWHTLIHARTDAISSGWPLAALLDAQAHTQGVDDTKQRGQARVAILG